MMVWDNYATRVLKLGVNLLEAGEQLSRAQNLDTCEDLQRALRLRDRSGQNESRCENGPELTPCPNHRGTFKNLRQPGPRN